MTSSRIFRRSTALLLLLAALTAAMTGCGKTNQNADRIAQLEKENAELRAQLAALTSQPATTIPGALDSWALEATALSAEDPASIRFAAVPTSHPDGQTASLLVTLDGREEVSVPCEWDGSSYTAFLTLPPADGYGYYCVLSGADGTPETLLLTAPDNPVKPSLTYLASAMNSFCNLFVEEWQAGDHTISIPAASVLMQMPLVTADGSAVNPVSCKLELRLNDSSVGEYDVPLASGETAGSYAASLTDLSFSYPEMMSDDQLDLWLVAGLSNGQTLSAPGGSWFFNGTVLELVVG